MNFRVCLLFVALALLTACSNTRPQVFYPVYVQVADVSDTFPAAFPDSRAKVFSEDNRSRRISMRLQLPSDWSFVTGATPGKTIEIYVLAGDLTLGEFELEPGGYAFLPSGSAGVSMSSVGGALLLYFIDNVQAGAVIQTPIISNSNLLDWHAASDAIEEFGLSTKELRMDPGSGARTWLIKIEPGAVQDWQKATTAQEGFLLSGQYRHSECAVHGVVRGEYFEGGYFLRPADAVNGGPESVAMETAVWLMRVPNRTGYTRNLYCGIESAK
jgi:hypothetical protein